MGSLAALALAPSVAQASSPDGPSTHVIVRAYAGAEPQAAAAIRAVGGTIQNELHSLDMVVATVPAYHVGRLGAAPGVAEVTPDGGLRLLDDDWKNDDGSDDTGAAADAVSTAVLPADTVGVTGVSNLWRSGATGQGIDVALIDSGVATVSGLDGGQVVHGPDLSFESQASNLAHLDTFGHGTHMASIIVGHDASVDPTRSSTWHNGYTGVAPGARLISIKVADTTGATDVTQVIAAIDWVVQHRNTGGLNIRVLNLSLGTDSTQSYVVDPLAHAAEVAWRNGIAVVVAAGNSGSSRTGLMDPAYDPYVIAVGAGDVAVGSVASRIRPASFTEVGDGTRNPDLLAPGMHIVGLRDIGSYIDSNFPGGRSGTRYFLGSGTSQASAYTSGAVADLLSARPGLTPDQVKALLRGTAKPLRDVSSTIQGTGVLHVQNAPTASAAYGAQAWPQSAGGGTLDRSRGSFHVIRDNQQLTGERDIFGVAVNTVALAAGEELGSTWSGGSWNGSTWSGSTWSGSTWSSCTWSGSTWSGSTWSGSTWSGSTWSASTWSASTWSAAVWS